MQRDATERSDTDGSSTPGPSFRLAVVPGVSPGKWVRVWHERLPDVVLELVHLTAAEAIDALRAGRADAGLVRLPVDRDVLSAIPLYTETTVVVVPVDHVVTAADEVTAGDLADERHLVPDDDVLSRSQHPATPPGAAVAEPARTTEADHPGPPPATTAEAVELVAAGLGVLVVPQSLARLHHRRDLTYRPVTDAPTSSVALAWRTETAPELVEELIGIVRGRTANSSRGRTPNTSRGRAADTRQGAPGSGGGGKRGDAGSKGTAAGTGTRGGRPRRPGGRGGTGRAR